MTDKKLKNKQNPDVMSEEDIQLYRLFMIFGAAILGFAGLRLVPEKTLYDVLGGIGKCDKATEVKADILGNDL